MVSRINKSQLEEENFRLLRQTSTLLLMIRQTKEARVAIVSLQICFHQNGSPPIKMLMKVHVLSELFCCTNLAIYSSSMNAA